MRETLQKKYAENIRDLYARLTGKQLALSNLARSWVSEMTLSITRFIENRTPYLVWWIRRRFMPEGSEFKCDQDSQLLTLARMERTRRSLIS